MAGKLVAERYGTENLTLLFADVNMEHPDNYRFLHVAHAWIGGELVILDNGGKTIWDVFKEGRFLGNSRVDLCSRVLKREPMRKWLEDNCDPEHTVSYLGFDWTEEHRNVKAQRYWNPWKMEAPMCWEPVMDKAEGMAAMAAAGVQPPWLTRMGFPHANCGGGCVKAGIGSFQRLRKISPETYAQWEWNEEQMRQFLGRDVAILTDRRGKKRRPLALRELRERDAVDPTLFDGEDDDGSCNCFTPPEDNEAAARREPPRVANSQRQRAAPGDATGDRSGRAAPAVLVAW